VTQTHHRRGHPGSQHRRSMALLVFGAVRIVCWTILGILVGMGLLHVGGFAWAKTLAESLPFVALISIYANWATDVDAATAAFAALVASDSHAAVVSTGAALVTDFREVETDIARLAALQPGTEAEQLAQSIRSRLPKAAA
jgi:hypothetical protein